MYTVLKTKRYHFQIPRVQLGHQNKYDNQTQENGEHKWGSQNIVGSCFLDDVFILFLFNNGRYLIVNNNSTSMPLQKKSATHQSQIIYEGHVISEVQGQYSYQKQVSNKSAYQTPSKRLMSKQSLNYTQECPNRIIFTECKRIRTNECIILTKHSKHVYWLKIIKTSVQSARDISNSIKIQIKELMGTMVSDILAEDIDYNIGNMTMLTQLLQFDNSDQNKAYNNMQHLNCDTDRKGSFGIKNQIVQDQTIYITVYTRIPEVLRQKYTQPDRHKQLDKIDNGKFFSVFPHFIVTKLQFPIPINAITSNFRVQISDKLRNQIAIYKQSEDDGIEWQIKLYNFGFEQLKGQQLVSSYSKQKQRQVLLPSNELTICNITNVPKPKIIVLPQQFTSCINIQQFICMNQNDAPPNQKKYLIVSISQTFNGIQEVNQNVIQNQNQAAYRVNGQVVYYQGGNRNLATSNNQSNRCWVHSCRLVYLHNSHEQFTQWFDKLNNINLDSTSFLKIINTNYSFGLIYALSLAHERVDGQLYQNKIDLIDVKTGRIVEKGYCSLKNYSFSPNQKFIIDVPYTFADREDFFYHMRLLFNKKSLYVFMMQNSKAYFQPYKNVNFIETVLSLL